MPYPTPVSKNKIFDFEGVKPPREKKPLNIWEDSLAQREKNSVWRERRRVYGALSTIGPQESALILHEALLTHLKN